MRCVCSVTIAPRGQNYQDWVLPSRNANDELNYALFLYEGNLNRRPYISHSIGDEMDAET